MMMIDAKIFKLGKHGLIMVKEIYVLSDIEIGGGTLTDDFIADRDLSNLIRKMDRKNTRIDLVLNGDTFDFLKCPDTDGTYPRHITVEVSLRKLQMMMEAHTKVFTALRKFVQNKLHKVYFIIGNHDHDLYFGGVQRKLRAVLGARRNVYFQLHYKNKSVRCEHGHQYDFLNKINPKNPFLQYKKEKILNIPWVSFGLISKFLHIKEDHPFMERIKPWPVIFNHHRLIVKKLNRKSVSYFLKSAMYYPIRYISDPTYRYPRELFREFYRRFKNRHWDVDDVVKKFKRKKKRSLRRNRLYILGHDHNRYLEDMDGVAIVNPDTWRDEYTIDNGSKEVISKEKRYVHVIMHDDGRLEWELVTHPCVQRVYSFDEILKDEYSFIQKAANASGYVLHSPLPPKRAR